MRSTFEMWYQHVSSKTAETWHGPFRSFHPSPSTMMKRTTSQTFAGVFMFPDGKKSSDEAHLLIVPGPAPWVNVSVSVRMHWWGICWMFKKGSPCWDPDFNHTSTAPENDKMNKWMNILLQSEQIKRIVDIHGVIPSPQYSTAPKWFQRFPHVNPLPTNGF